MRGAGIPIGKFVNASRIADLIIAVDADVEQSWSMMVLHGVLVVVLVAVLQP